jgi:type II secretion system protein H
MAARETGRTSAIGNMKPAAFPGSRRGGAGLLVCRGGWKFRPRAARGGFSLIELMVVVVLIGIMAAMIIPEMKGTYEEALLRSTSRELVGVFNIASSRAISLNQFLRVRLDLGTGRYATERQASDRTTRSAFVPVRDLPGGEGKLDTRISVKIRKPSGEDDRSEPAAVRAPEDADIPEGSAAIAFYPDGTAEASEIVLQDRAGFRLALRVNPVTSRVRVVELERL